MAYHTTLYLCLFLPLALIIYGICPAKHRWKALLLFSYLFFYSISQKLVVFLMGSSVVTHYVGVWLDAVKNQYKAEANGLVREEKKVLKAQYRKRERWILFFGIAAMVGCLGYLKYYNFFAGNINVLLDQAKIAYTFSPKDLLLPIGISFYTLQAVGYMIDVYRDKYPAEKSLLKFSLFLGFFPQIMEGPICRYDETAKDLYAGKPLQRETLLYGCQRIIWGLFKKMVIADRLNILVKEVFEHYQQYGGVIIIAGAVCYTIQLYMEFSGAIDIVIGSGQMFGVQLPENFRQPFFSRNASEFWRRWHISLGAWFRDYIFYTVSMAAPLKKWNKFGRKHAGEYVTRIVLTAAALFPVWLCNGLWHGASWSYIFYGMYYFVIITLENITEPLAAKILGKLKIDPHNIVYHGFQIIKTLVIIFTGELFFRAETVTKGFEMFFSIFRSFEITKLWDGSLLTLGLDAKDWMIIAAALLVVLAAGLIKEKGIAVRLWIAGQKLPLRWCIYYAAIYAVIIFGAFGPGYEPVDLIYAGF